MIRSKKMARTLYKKSKDGKVIYVGHVPDEYKLKENEIFKLPIQVGKNDK